MGHVRMVLWSWVCHDRRFGERLSVVFCNNISLCIICDTFSLHELRPSMYIYYGYTDAINLAMMFWLVSNFLKRRWKWRPSTKHSIFVTSVVNKMTSCFVYVMKFSIIFCISYLIIKITSILHTNFLLLRRWFSKIL